MRMGLFVAVVTFVMLGCGGGSAQPAECKKWLECLNAVSAGSGDSISASYGEQGTCWITGSTTAESCKTACVNGLADRSGQANAPAACK